MTCSYYDRVLLKCSTREEFDLQLEERSRLWDPAFTAYYMSQCYPHADLNGKWSAIKFGWTGFTERANFVSNQSEHVKTKYLTFYM